MTDFIKQSLKSYPNGLLSKLFIFALILFFLPLLEDASAQSPPEAKIELTASEKTWLGEHPEIRLAIDNNWAPFEFVDEQKQYQGMAADYIRLVENRLGIKLKIDLERPWPEMVEAVKDRELDAFSLVVRTPQRDEFVNFTKPYISFPMVIVTREGEPYIDGIEALSNRSVSVVKSYASHDLLTKNHPNLDLHPADNVRKGLEAVSNGKTYAFVGNLAVVGHVIGEAGLTNLQISGQTPYRFELSMAVRNDWPELIPILQKALDSITTDERNAIYGRWIRVTFQEDVDYRLILFVILVASGIVLFIFGWNKKLRNEIENRQKAENALKASEQKYRAMFTSANVGLALCKLDGTLLEVNQGYCDILGRTEADTLEVSYWDITPREYEPQEKQQLASLRDRGTYGPYEKEYIRLDGTRVPVLLNGSLVVDQDGEPLIWSVVQDISDRKKAEEKVELALANASEASKAKSEFLASMSHELRTPLNAILGFSEMIATETFGLHSNPKYREYGEDVHRSGRHLLAIVNDVLDLSKVEAGKIEVHTTEFALNEAIRECTGLFSNASNASREIEISVENGLETLVADLRLFRQILINLLSNAVKYTPHDGKIRVIATADQVGTTYVRVQDDGIGIAADEIEKVLQPFGQARANIEITHEGTGLGLSLSKMLMEAQGGKLEIESKEGVGTTVILIFPNQG